MPNNQETNTEVHQESAPQFDLSDVSVLTELFEVVLYDVVRRSNMVSSSQLKQEEAGAIGGLPFGCSGWQKRTIYRKALLDGRSFGRLLKALHERAF